jgi:hypothetical protein
MLKVKPTVGSRVTKHGKPLSEHGVVTAINQDTVTVRWHLKQDEMRGRAGTQVGRYMITP